jgi:hypothetical protein
LAKILGKEFSLNELRLIQYGDDSILIESRKLARLKARR